MDYPIETLTTRTSSEIKDRQKETDLDYAFWLSNYTGSIAFNRDMGMLSGIEGVPKKNIEIDELLSLAVEIATVNYNSGAKQSRQVLTNSQLMEFKNGEKSLDSERNSSIGYYRLVDLQRN